MFIFVWKRNSYRTCTLKPRILDCELTVLALSRTCGNNLVNVIHKCSHLSSLVDINKIGKVTVLSLMSHVNIPTDIVQAGTQRSLLLPRAKKCSKNAFATKMMFHAQIASKISPCELHFYSFTCASNTKHIHFASVRDRFLFFVCILYNMIYRHSL